MGAQRMVPNQGGRKSRKFSWRRSLNWVLKDKQIFAGRLRWEWGWRERLGPKCKGSPLSVVGETA